MNAEVKKLWLEALRSGEYKQTHNALQKDGSFCCLGVLCDIAVKNHLGLDVHQRIADNPEGLVSYDGKMWALPDSVVKWSGVTKFGELPKRIGKYRELAELNDEAEYTFSQIADVIEEQL